VSRVESSNRCFAPQHLFSEQIQESVFQAYKDTVLAEERVPATAGTPLLDPTAVK